MTMPKITELMRGLQVPVVVARCPKTSARRCSNRASIRRLSDTFKIFVFEVIVPQSYDANGQLVLFSTTRRAFVQKTFSDRHKSYK
jgi:hypothetical protein